MHAYHTYLSFLHGPKRHFRGSPGPKAARSVWASALPAGQGRKVRLHNRLSSAWLSRGRTPCLHCDPRFPASTMRLRIRDGRLVFERMPEAALVALFLKKSCIRSAVFAIALPGGRAILWAFLGTSRFLHSARIGVFLFAGKTCELKPNYLGLRRSMQEQASTINFSGNAG